MLKNLQAELNAFGKYVVQQSRSNLTKQKRNVTKDLYNSIKYDLTEDSNNYDLAFIMDEYGTFLDKGVKGAKPSLVKNGKQKGGNSPYSYKTKMPPMNDIMAWAKKRNIRLRDEKGKFKKGNYKAIGFIIQRSVFAQGIKPSFFFTKAFDNAFKRYPKLLIEAFLEDITDIIKINNGKN